MNILDTHIVTLHQEKPKKSDACFPMQVKHAFTFFSLLWDFLQHKL